MDNITALREFAAFIYQPVSVGINWIRGENAATYDYRFVKRHENELRGASRNAA